MCILLSQNKTKQQWLHVYRTQVLISSLVFQWGGNIVFTVVGGAPCGSLPHSVTIQRSPGNSPSVRPVNERPSVRGAVPHSNKQDVSDDTLCEHD